MSADNSYEKALGGVVGKVHQVAVDVHDGAGGRECRQDRLGEERGGGELAAVDGIVGTAIELGGRSAGRAWRPPLNGRLLARAMLARSSPSVILEKQFRSAGVYLDVAQYINRVTRGHLQR